MKKKDVMTRNNFLIVCIHLVKNSNHQVRHFIMFLNVVNNTTNNYRTCQSLLDVSQLLLQPTFKKPNKIIEKMM